MAGCSGDGSTGGRGAAALGRRRRRPRRGVALVGASVGVDVARRSRHADPGAESTAAGRSTSRRQRSPEHARSADPERTIPRWSSRSVRDEPITGRSPSSAASRCDRHPPGRSRPWRPGDVHGAVTVPGRDGLAYLFLGRSEAHGRALIPSSSPAGHRNGPSSRHLALRSWSGSERTRVRTDGLRSKCRG